METRGIAPIVSHFRLSDFRNYEHAELEPSHGFNIISGPNAQGKTNLVEAIHLVSTGRVLRGSRDSQAIRKGAEKAVVEATLAETKTTVGVDIKKIKGKTVKTVRLNGASLPRPSDVIGRVPTVSFSARDLMVVRGEPVERRHFLDSELSQLYPAYLRHLSIYKRALEQRNALLKASRETYHPAELYEVWEQQLAEHGSQIRLFRSRWVSSLAELVHDAHEILGGGEQVQISYSQKDLSEDAASLMAALQDRRREEAERGHTTIGPHRDDLTIEVAGMNARQYGSQGQQRTAVIALKLAVMKSAAEIFGFSPVLLLDDVFSDLDQSRRSSLVNMAMSQGGQVFLTCTESEQAGVELVGSSKLFRVVSGTVEEA